MNPLRSGRYDEIKQRIQKGFIGNDDGNDFDGNFRRCFGATRTTVTAEPVQATVTLDQRPVATMQFNRIHLKRTSTKAIANQVQTTVDASALNLDQQHRDQQLK